MKPALARDRLRQVLERWFLTEPLLFSLWSDHRVMVEPVANIRVGVGIIDYWVLRLFRRSVLSERRRLTHMKPSRRYDFLYFGSRYEFATRLLVAVDISGSMRATMGPSSSPTASPRDRRTRLLWLLLDERTRRHGGEALRPLGWTLFLGTE